MKARSIVLVAFPGVQALDVIGPADVFSTADRLAGAGSRYHVEVAALRAGAVITGGGGIGIQATRALRDIDERIDTLLVAGGAGVDPARGDRALVDEVRRLAGRSRRYGSVCSGTFILATAGLLHNRHVTTHWASARRLAAEFPDIDVEPDRIFVNDGRLWTSAGVTAGIDLALELVAADYGRDASLDVARWLVVYLQRPGGQTQFSTHLSSKAPSHEALRELQAWIEQHPSEDLSVAALADRARMSTRTFQRLFRQQTGTTPGAFVERVRLEAARRSLETTDLSLPQIAKASGFGAVETLYHAFGRQLGVPPAAYRSRFRQPAISEAAVR